MRSPHTAGKESTRWSYQVKGKHFTFWAQQKTIAPGVAGIPLFLDYLLSLKAAGLALSSIKMHIAAISAFPTL